MTGKGARELVDRGADEIGIVVAHPAQVQGARDIASLITDLRTLSTSSEFYAFQGELFHAIYDAELAAATASRNVKRERAGRVTDEAPDWGWTIEYEVHSRVARQLRTVGDALAWRLFNFDRRMIIALSQNTSAGPMAHQQGLPRELGAVVWHHETNGTFALLHGVTNCLRIGDMTIFEPDGPKLHEAKTSAPQGSRYRRQIERIQHAIEVINNGAPLGPQHDVDLFAASKPLKTHIPQLRSTLKNMGDSPAWSTRLGEQQVLTVVNGRSPREISDEFLKQTKTYKRRAFERASLPETDHHLQTNTVDVAGRSASIAPFSIFPLSAAECAALTVNVTVFEVTIGVDRLVTAFERRGFQARHLFNAEIGRIDVGEPILALGRRGRTIIMNQEALGELLFELCDIDRYADAVAEFAELGAAEDGLKHGIVTFANERAVWR